MATEYTPYYNLDLYTDSDKPNLRDQYNAAMRKVDAQLHAGNESAVVAIEAANQARATANAASEALTAETTAREAAGAAIESAFKAADSEIEAAYKSADSALANRVAALEAIDVKTKYYGHRMVVIGDSYSYGTGASDHGGSEQLRFSTRLANMLGATEVNVAVGSTGFCDPGSGGQNSPFPTQVAQATASLDVSQRADVRLVIIAGGINDEREGTTYSSAQMETAAKNTCIAAHSSFPNADIVVFPMLWNGQGWQYHAFNFERVIVGGVMKSNCASAVQGCWTWNFGNASNFASDNLHPNDAGHLEIANRMYESLTQGGVSNYANNLFIPSINGGSTNNRTYGVFQNGVIQFGGMLVGASGSSVSSNTQIGSVPAAMQPQQNIYAPIFKSNQIAGMFCITAAGNVYVNPTSEVTFPVYVAPFSYVPYGGTLN